MWQQAGASIVNIPSNEVYNALQSSYMVFADEVSDCKKLIDAALSVK